MCECECVCVCVCVCACVCVRACIHMRMCGVGMCGVMYMYLCVYMPKYVHEQSMNHISLKKDRPRCYTKSCTHCGQHVSVNNRPHQLCWCDWEIWIAISYMHASDAILERSVFIYG